MGTAQTSFGQSLRSRRKALGLSREAVAWAIGRTVVTIGNWECDRTRPSEDDLRNLCRFLQCAPRDLLDAEESGV